MSIVMARYSEELGSTLRQYIDSNEGNGERNELKEALIASESVKIRYAVLKDVKGTELFDTWTGVHKAAHDNDLDILKEMLSAFAIEQKYDIVKTQNIHNETALHKAASEGYTLIVSYLLDGFTPQQKYKLLKLQDTSGDTALHKAIEENTEVVEVILSAVKSKNQTKLMNIKNRKRQKCADLKPQLGFASPALNLLGICSIFNVY